MAIPAVAARVRAWLSGLPPLAILGAAWLFALIYAFPGIMTFDSSDQLDQGRANFYSDGHPPVMAKLWRYVDAIIPGPFGMLVIQTVALAAGLYLMFRRALPARRAAVAAAAVFVFPPVLAPMAVVWKDAPMAGFLMLGLAGVLAGRRVHRVLGLVALWLATAVRYNAFAATAPLVVLCFTWPGVTRWYARYGLALAAWLAITASAFGANAALTDVEMHYWQSSLAVFDIAGTLDHVDGTIPDDELRQTLAGTRILVDKDIHAAIRAAYKPGNFDTLLVGPGHLWDLPVQGSTPAPDDQLDAITRAFWDVVTAHPGAYLRHRAALGDELFGVHQGSLSKVVRTHASQLDGYLQNQHLSTGASTVQRALQRAMLWIAHRTPLFRPWIYLVLALIALAFVRRDRELVALLLSGIGLEASLFVLAPTPDFRYSHWLVLATVVAIALAAVRRYGAGGSRR
ncbi:MAG TPA: hypothetical protein VLX92_32995 [Kofleriaceae bacterium]|nr:hypothetical protein [Kofleriaceae bacterium]